MARVRLQDVAERAGVSIKTVSNVVNGKGSITPETREKVQEALRALPYRPNVAAQHLRRGKSGIIAVALPDLTQPYFAELASHLVRAAKARQLTVLLTQTDGLAASERFVSDGIDLPLMDGLILSPLVLGSAELRDRLDDTPLVLLGEHVGTDAAFPHVAIDNRAAARDATMHLIDQGRRRVAAIGAQQARRADGTERTGRETSELRLDGYRTALDDAGLPWRPELVPPVTEFHRADGAQAMRALLALPEPPDAVFCFSDLLAVGALRALKEGGRSVPHDVAVVGIDGIEEAGFSSPTLTTVVPDKRSLAETALTLLVEQRAEPRPRPRTVVVGHRLIIRESSDGPGVPRP